MRVASGSFARVICVGITFAVALILCAPDAADAQTVHCRIARSNAGFVTLHAQPRTSAPPVTRMRTGDEVMVVNDQERLRDWRLVHHWGRSVPYERRPPFRRGYVQLRLLVDCDS
jgi:3-dehydroquinate synthase class II